MFEVGAVEKCKLMEEMWRIRWGDKYISSFGWIHSEVSTACFGKKYWDGGGEKLSLSLAYLKLLFRSFPVSFKKP